LWYAEACVIPLRVQAVAAREDHFAGIKLFQFDIVALYSISIGEGCQ
jgi:hypothetical protein